MQEICDGGVSSAIFDDTETPELDDVECTDDACADGEATHTSVDDLCDDEDICTADTCGGVELEPGCHHSAITNCCVEDADCNDTVTCTSDACNLDTNRCVFTPLEDCCTEDDVCADDNLCTTDYCTIDHMCGNEAIDDCCLTNGDCADDDACTTDTCSTPGGSCLHNAIDGCCNLAEDCEADHDCIDHACVASSDEDPVTPSDDSTGGSSERTSKPKKSGCAAQSTSQNGIWAALALAALYTRRKR